MIALVSVHSVGATPEAVIAADETRAGLSAALTALGWQVAVVVEAAFDAEVLHHGVRWVFCRPDASVLAARALWGRVDPAPHIRCPTPHLLRAVQRLKPSLIHSFDLVFYPHLLGLAQVGVPIIAHFHGGAAARRLLWRRLEQRALGHVARLCFTALEQAEGWVHNGYPQAHIAQVFETSVMLDPAPPRATTPTGPRLISVGRLDAVKDPLTVLAGFAAFRKVEPTAELHLAWTHAPLLDAVRAHAGPGVIFHGHLGRDEARRLIASGQALLQASTREVCGVAVLEAMALGVPPVVTDIPAFRAVLGDTGARFAVGDAAGLARALPAVLSASAGQACRARFDAALSFAALARRIAAVYNEVLAENGLGPRP